MRMSECWDATGFDPAALLVIVTVIVVRDSLVGLFSHFVSECALVYTKSPLFKSFMLPSC